jgi:hypothetical protein
VIHILTLHFATNAWLEIQKRHILKYTNKEDYKLWLGKYNLELPEEFEFPANWELIDLDKDYPEENINEHYLQMEWMYGNYIKNEMTDDDIVVFIDSDAFPCEPRWIFALKEAIEGDSSEHRADVVCLYQMENRGMAQPDEYYPYPDLCFFATTKKAWVENNLEWGLFSPDHQNPGFGMHDRIAAAELRVGALTRTNRFNAHRVMFGVYGDMIYHQACGSRAIIGRPMATGQAAANNRRQCYTGVDLFGRSLIGNWFEEEFEEECADIINTNTEIFDIIYNKIQKDQNCTFIRRYFMGKS